MAKIGISEQEYQSAATIIGCDVAAIKAVDTVESRGAGFLPDGQVKILFEPHIFWQRLKKHGLNPLDYQAANADILYPKWVPGKYGPVSSQWGRMDRAIKIHRTAALESASYGRYQIMGFNYAYCGFTDVQKFLNHLALSEGNHLDAFVKYIKSAKIDDELRAHHWSAFAESYNGPAYKKNAYDKKLLEAYNKFK